MKEVEVWGIPFNVAFLDPLRLEGVSDVLRVTRETERMLLC